VAERISHAITDAEHPHVTVVIIRMSKLGLLDATGAHTLAEMAQ
jgi:SulP family sulfate permease